MKRLLITAVVALIAAPAAAQELTNQDLNYAEVVVTGSRIDLVDAASRSVVASFDTGGVPATRLTFIGSGLVVAIVDRDLRAWAAAVRIRSPPQRARNPPHRGARLRD